MTKKIKILIENSVPYLSGTMDEISSTNVYVYNIIINLSRKYPDIEIIVLTNGRLYIDKFKDFPNIKIIFSKVRNPLLWLNVIVPFYGIINKVDVIFFGKSATCIFPLYGIKIISTIHGMIYKLMPETSSIIENIYWRLMAKIAYRISNKIVVVSDRDYSDLIEDGCKKEKLKKIYIGLDQKYITHQPKPEIDYLSPLKLVPKKYLLQIGGISKKKNQQFTLDIFASIAKSYPEYKMIFIGPILDKAYLIELNEYIYTNGLADRVVFFGGINQNTEFDKFLQILKNSKIFYFPSIYEGFGIPPLEAISQGVPSLISNKGSLVEVYGSINTIELNKDKWIDITVKLLNNDPSITFMQKNQNKILKKYKWETIIQDYHGLFINKSN